MGWWGAVREESRDLRADILGIMQRMFLLGQGPRVGMGVGGYIEFKNQIKKKKMRPRMKVV